MRRRFELCKGGGCCPAIEIDDREVRVGEEGNLCVLKPEEWRALRDLVLRGDV